MNICLASEIRGESSEAIARLVLLGTIHYDPKGFGMAVRSLDSLRPDLILLEMSPFARVFRKRNHLAFHKSLRQNIRVASGSCGIPIKDALRHPEIMAIKRQISFPYEYRAAAQYARRQEAKLLLVDYSDFSRKWIASWPELISVENLTNLLALPPDTRRFRDTYWLAERCIRGKGISYGSGLLKGEGSHDAFWKLREHFMARQVRTAIVVLKPERPVYIGGWWHLTTGNNLLTVRDLLQVDPSRCRLLNEFTE